MHNLLHFQFLNFQRTDADVNAGVDLVLTIEIRSVSESESLSPGNAVLLLSVVLIDVLEDPRRGGLRNDLVLKLSDSIKNIIFEKKMKKIKKNVMLKSFNSKNQKRKKKKDTNKNKTYQSQLQI